MLSDIQFPNGFIAFWMAQTIEPVAIHSNWGDLDTKIYRARELMHWNMDDAERYFYLFLFPPLFFSIFSIFSFFSFFFSSSQSYDYKFLTLSRYSAPRQYITYLTEDDDITFQVERDHLLLVYSMTHISLLHSFSLSLFLPFTLHPSNS